MASNGGGPAFPAVIPIEHSNEQGKDYLNYTEAGMTLRDYFAAKAMAAYIISNPGDCIDDPDRVANWAYENADAMLQWRQK